MTLTHIATRDALLRVILRHEMRLSGALVRRLKFEGAFTVNGAVARTNHPVHAGDVIQAVLLENEPDFPAEHGELRILYEDEAILVLDKPQGLIVHPTFNRLTGTLANYIYGYFQETGQSAAVHPVTRLDRDTFGVVLFAKNTFVHAQLCEQQLAHAFQKTYLAITVGVPPQPSGEIDLPIARPDPMDIRRCVREDGLPAKTHYRVLAAANGYAALELHPVTGRTHQLRVHCAAMGCPILGDPQYGTRVDGLEGQMLCAARLSFTHPITNATLSFDSRQTDLLRAAAEKNQFFFDFVL